MIDFLLGVPAKLSAIAAQITGLGTPAQASTITTLAKASTITTLATNLGTPLQAVSPIAMPPKQGGLIGGANPLAGSPAPALFTLINGLLFTTTSSTDTVIVNIAGKGVLNYLAVSSRAAQTPIGAVTLIIDGVTLFNRAVLGTHGHAAVIVGCLFNVDASDASKYGVSLDQIPFNSSLVIKHHSTAYNDTINTHVKYRVTG